MVPLKASLYPINVVYVELEGATSGKEYSEVVKKYGLSRHIALAYLIALRRLKHTMKSLTMVSISL